MRKTLLYTTFAMQQCLSLACYALNSPSEYCPKEQNFSCIVTGESLNGGGLTDTATCQGDSIISPGSQYVAVPLVVGAIMGAAVTAGVYYAKDRIGSALSNCAGTIASCCARNVSEGERARLVPGYSPPPLL